MKTNLPNRPVAKMFRIFSLLLLLTAALTGCKTSRMAGTAIRNTGYLSSKVQLTVPHRNATLTVNGTMKLKDGERMQLSFLMPILRTEAVRMEVTPEEILLVDRIGKRYVQLTRRELIRILPKKTDFARLEKFLHAASKTHGKRTLTGKELGIPSLEKGKIELSDFSDKEFTLSPTLLSQRYMEVSLQELLEMLMDL